MTSFLDDFQAELRALRAANDEFAKTYPQRPPETTVHTLYVPQDRFSPDLNEKMGRLAIKAVESWGGDARSFASIFGISGALAEPVYRRMLAQLARPVRRANIDEEDGYGHRPDDEEDRHAAQAGAAAGDGVLARSNPPYLGYRIKALTNECAARGLRSLGLFLEALVAKTQGKLPDNFVVTLPKISHPRQVETLVAALEKLEQRLGLARGAVALDLMIELNTTLVYQGEVSALRRFIGAGAGRVVAVAFGTYDYTACLGITAHYQSHVHPVADLARGLLQIAVAGTGIRLSDGATTVMPVPPHKAAAGKALTPEQERSNRETVHAAWKLHWDNIHHSFRNGYLEGWDLNPAQLPVRWAAMNHFYLSQLDDATERLRVFVEEATHATLTKGAQFDDLATAEGCKNFFKQGLACGALTEAEAKATGCTLEEINTKSFREIAAARAAART
jgi:hypothetical protein